MSLKRIYLTGLAAALMSPAASVLAQTAGPVPPDATAITQVSGDGQRLTAVVLAYDEPLANVPLSVGDFVVKDRRVTRAYVSDHAEPGVAAAGPFVVIELAADDTDATLKVEPPWRSGPPPAEGGVGGGPPPGMAAPVFRPAVATVERAPALTAVDGSIKPSIRAPLDSRVVRNLVVDSFTQHVFCDPVTGDCLAYNLFVPADYDPARAYPLVLFMHDAGNTSSDPLTTLRQGNGATIWAEPQNQAKHPALVLAPQYATQTVNDGSQATSLLDTTVHLVEALTRQYSIDRNRLYATGQSGGAMMTIAMDIKYPDLFAASYIVAGQWDAALVAPLADDRLWITVAEGDLKAFPGQNAITSALAAKGAEIARAQWDGRASTAQFDALAADLIAKGAPINYVVLAKGTVVPSGQPDNGGSNHTNTWRIAYSIDAIRDWLMRQHR
ncbi:prolyl oligopeptidase family serine peptidase (plasmid) [Sphingomonas changnyeongensis]|uniref:Prolyl oligopeptidase family serine peptidase n=1 Tax=Sphingomonas changnyeongensis TaxID=2698679 RepID=A0A7Z2NZA4_9SPHN|nr:PHB depolymerase family esterase [Sphingomonas changnyeongensis]QHL92014.1 prolyl oligopeptidase family serine peptidase [Sphingomonas changnyeongensis]